MRRNIFEKYRSLLIILSVLFLPACEEVIITAAAVALLIIVVLFLVFREFFLWYWKINEIVGLLADIRALLRQKQQGEGTTEIEPSKPSLSDLDKNCISEYSKKSNLDQINVKSLKFYTTSDETPLEQKEYKTAFEQKTTCRIHFELLLKHKSPEMTKELLLGAVCYDENNNLIDKTQNSIEIKPVDLTSSVFTGSIGWDEPDKWREGKYSVDFFDVHTGKKITSGSFTIVTITEISNLKKYPDTDDWIDVNEEYLVGFQKLGNKLKYLINNKSKKSVKPFFEINFYDENRKKTGIANINWLISKLRPGQVYSDQCEILMVQAQSEKPTRYFSIEFWEKLTS